MAKRSWWLAAMWFVLSTCGEPSDRRPSSGVNVDQRDPGPGATWTGGENDPNNPWHVDATRVEAWIGAAGGQLHLDDAATLTLAPQAFSEPTLVVLRAASPAGLPVPIAEAVVSRIVDIQPHGHLLQTGSVLRMVFDTAAPRHRLGLLHLRDLWDRDWEVQRGVDFAAPGEAVMALRDFGFYAVVVFTLPGCQNNEAVACDESCRCCEGERCVDGTPRACGTCGVVCGDAQFCALAHGCLVRTWSAVCQNSRLAVLGDGHGPHDEAAALVAQALSERCGLSVQTYSQDSQNPPVLDSCTGMPRFDAGTTLVVAGDAAFHRSLPALAQGVLPIDWKYDAASGRYRITDEAGAAVADYSAADMRDGKQVLVLQLGSETQRGFLVAHVQGHGDLGTRAAAAWLAHAVARGESDFFGAYAVARWHDDGDGLWQPSDRLEMLARGL